MPQIGANFIYNSYKPNFERDSLTKSQMRDIPQTDMDVGHIVYCQTDNTHYIFQGGNEDSCSFDQRWKKFQTEEELIFWTVDITNGTHNQDGSITFTTDIGDHSWDELKSIGNNNKLLILVLIDGEHKTFMPCNIEDLGAIINISSRHLTGMSTGGYELYLNCQQDRGTTPWGIIGGGKLYYYEDTISNDYINNLN